ncbi:hypothetical protein [Kitasatospora herbaricolor]|uniref:Uncharacterized protein n=1 Tax=Kitasatospora herbaricolor TaxID=68217 RepID=A0ABZ1WJI4_9ACTN|nr:hypothetical protein [Kitasatospora herbaricolor]
MPTQWVHQFRNCPDTDDVQALVPVEELDRPRQSLAREREGAGGLVDGYILQSLDGRSRTAVYTWVQAGDPGTVEQYLRELSTEIYPQGKAR